MCDPITLGVVGSVALTGYQINAENKAADAANRQQEEAMRNALKNLGRRNNEIELQRNIEQSNVQEALNQKNIQAAKLASQVRLSAREGGIAGVGVERLITDVGAQLSQQTSVLERNFANIGTQAQFQSEGNQRQTQNMLDRLAIPNEGVSSIEAVTRIGKSALGGISTFSSLPGGGKSFGELFNSDDLSDTEVLKATTDLE